MLQSEPLLRASITLVSRKERRHFMNNQEQPLSPCPECGGPRTWFRVEQESICIVAGFAKGALLYACTCLECGAITLRPAPNRMEAIRQ